MKAQEIAWLRGFWNGRERVPEGYASLIENAEALGDGAIRARRGASIHAQNVGGGGNTDIRHGAPFRTGAGQKATVLLAADGRVFDIEGATTQIGTVEPSDEYDTDQGLDRLYVATGGEPYVVGYDSVAPAFYTSTLGVNKPDAPTLVSVGAAGVTNPIDPIAVNADYLAIDPVGGTNGRIYAVGPTGQLFERYDVASNAWTDLDAVGDQTPAAVNEGAVLNRNAEGRILYAPNARTTLDLSVVTKATYYFTPSPSDGTWSANKPLQITSDVECFWSHASSICVTAPLWGNSTYAVLYYYRNIGFGTFKVGYGLFQLIEAPTETTWVFVADLVSSNTAVNLGLNWNSIAASLLIATATTGVLVLVRDNECWQINVGTGSVVQLGNPGFTCTRFDRLVYAGASSDYIFCYREAVNNIRRYSISANTWANNPGNSGPVRNRGIMGGQPANQNVYYTGTGTDFLAEALPDATLPSGDYRYVITWITAQTESAPSSELIVNDAPDGANITIALPTPPGGVTNVRIYRSLKDGTTLGLRAEIAYTETTYSDPAADSGFLDFGISPPGPVGGSAGGVVPTGAKAVIFYDNQSLWGNLEDAPSDLMWSRTKSPEVFSGTWRLSVQANDGDEIVGLAGLPAGRLVLKSRSIHLVTGDLGEPPDTIGSYIVRPVSQSIGCASRKSIAVLGRMAHFAGGDGFQRGVYVTDGVSAPVRISSPAIDELIPEDIADAVAFVADERYYISFDGQTFLVWDPTWKRWETRVTFEEHRDAATIAHAFFVPDIGRRYAIVNGVPVVGNRIIRFAERGLAVSAKDPLRLRLGPLPYGRFEQDLFLRSVIIRYKAETAATLWLSWKTDVAGAFYVYGQAAQQGINIVLPESDTTSSKHRHISTRCYGRRIFLELAFFDVAGGDCVIEGIEADWGTFERQEGAS